MKTENPLQPLDRLIIKDAEIIRVQRWSDSDNRLIVDCDYIVLPTSTWHNAILNIDEDMQIYVFTDTLLQANASYKAHPLEIARAFHCSCEYMDTGIIKFMDNYGKSVSWADGKFGALKC